MLQFIIRNSLVASQLPLLKEGKCGGARQEDSTVLGGWSGRKGGIYICFVFVYFHKKFYNYLAVLLKMM